MRYMGTIIQQQQQELQLKLIKSEMFLESPAEGSKMSGW